MENTLDKAEKCFSFAICVLDQKCNNLINLNWVGGRAGRTAPDSFLCLRLRVGAKPTADFSLTHFPWHARHGQVFLAGA